MGSSTSLYETKHSDERYILLISGFLRITGFRNRSASKNMVSKLLRICVEFYCLETHQNLLIWSGTTTEGNNSCNGLSLINISNYTFNKKNNNSEIYRFNIHNLDDNNFCGVEWNDNFDKINSSYSLVTNITTLPQWIKNKYTAFDHNRKNQHKKYNIIVRIGSDETLTHAKNNSKSRCDVMIFDANHTPNNLIESYYTSEVDTFPRMPAITNTNIICNHNNEYKGVIFGYGGKQRNNKIWNNIYSLDINTLKVQQYSKLCKPKSGVTLTIDNNNNILLCGGMYENLKSDKTCTMLKSEIIQKKNWYDTDSNMCIKIGDLNYNRIYAGSTYLNNDNNKIIIGGGCTDIIQGSIYEEDMSSHSMEMYDINKNKWNLLQCKTNKSHFNPLIWNDNINNNIIYISGNKTENDTVKNLGYVEWFDIRENKKRFNVLFNNEPINHLFGLTKKNNTDKRNWLSRALLI